ncbi:cobyrinate a,c-diamide synthase [Planktotalea sp.]|uniref:cobyrinate a,c-diamide synthase n=1 Tax=Planktotalea sp. TaxID=2029877 RepID=UPI0025FFBC14|nr:cobyrinate a,c-diamide synthase [Planktotalea sp.]
MRPHSGLIIAAPASGSGKTTITLGLLRAFKRNGISVRGAKSGPDYIDPRFHEAASCMPCFNLDAWAMQPKRIATLAAGDASLIIEGAMGLFDGAPPDGRGSVADLARMLRLPVILVVDAARMAHSIAPLVAGFARHDPDIDVAGVILNKVGSERHERILRLALAPLGLPVLGAIPRRAGIETPSRHLGLVQAQERDDLDAFIERAADLVEQRIDLNALSLLATSLSETDFSRKIAPPAQRIAIAQDRAFAFAYPHILKDWRDAGAEILPFSPLANTALPENDFVFLPGGYPELFAGHLAGASTFLSSLRKHSEAKPVYGECGGYMLLGDSLTDANGTRHAMAGLLRLETSFAKRKLHLGYRQLGATKGPFLGQWNAHEFHYASTISAKGTSLFKARDAETTTLPDMGLTLGNVSGSFAHIIDQA